MGFFVLILSCAEVLRFSGSQSLWLSGSLVLRFSGSQVLWFSSYLTLSFSDPVVLRFSVLPLVFAATPYLVMTSQGLAMWNIDCCRPLQRTGVIAADRPLRGFIQPINQTLRIHRLSFIAASFLFIDTFVLYPLTAHFE